MLELVPSEIEKLVLPLPIKGHIDLQELDQQIRSAMSAQEVLEANSRAVLGGLGLSRAKQDCLLSGWMRLRNRRHRTSSEEKAEASEAA